MKSKLIAETESRIDIISNMIKKSEFDRKIKEIKDEYDTELQRVITHHEGHTTSLITK